MMNSKKNRMILLIAVISAVILAVVLCVALGRDPQPVGPTVAPGTRPVPPTVTTRPTQPSETTEPVPTTEPPEETTLPEPTETEPADTQPPRPTERPTEPEETVPETTVPTGVRFPYAIPGTELVIDALNPYTGVFLEDGSDRDADEICAIILRNTAPVCVEYVRISLIREDGMELIFTASAVDANSRIVVMEANAEGYLDMEYVDCTADVARVSHLEMSEDQILIEENKDGSLAVTNISGEDIPCVRIFYKFHMEDVDVYVGGITYTAKLENLAADETRSVRPSHYAQGSSRIVMVKIYDTVD